MVKLVDDRGCQYLSAREGSAVLPGTSAPLNTPFGPGESYFTTFLLTFLRTRATLVCSISDVHPVSRLLVHHEDSPLQGKIYPARNPSAAPTVSGLQ
jgi:hypothetical protein